MDLVQYFILQMDLVAALVDAPTPNYLALPTPLQRRRAAPKAKFSIWHLNLANTVGALNQKSNYFLDFFWLLDFGTQKIQKI